jgi:ribosomal protein S21
MKKDSEVKLYMHERHKGTSQRIAAARAGISERTGRTYEHVGQLPSHRKRPHDWVSRPNPFAQDWPWVVAQLERDPALQGTTLFALLCEQHPERYRPTQVRTLQRHISHWKAVQGPEQEVIFLQQHRPGERAQSDFTHMEDLGVTLGGEAFPHLVYHFVLTYSNVEAVSICFGETFEALAEGVEKALWQLGGVPEQHRTDHLSAAVRQLKKAEQEEWTVRYQALMSHYGMLPTWNNAGIAHENGDVEQAHHRFKQAVDQALRVRGSRDFADRAAYEHFVQTLVSKRNQTRATRFAAEQAALRPLPATQLAPCKELRVVVSRFSTIAALGNTYSVPSRLIGSAVLVRIRAESLEGYVGASRVFTLPRLSGKQQHHNNNRHIISSLVRKPGAIAAYRYRDDLLPTTTFRQAYDQLLSDRSLRADQEYVHILHLAATTSEAEVETALGLLLEAKLSPRFTAVRELVSPLPPTTIPPIEVPTLDLTLYDTFIPSRSSHA